MALTPGTRLGPYEIVTLLGAGGMGEVYRARDPRLGRDVAIKTLRGLTSREQSRRLELEARAMAALNHPNIIAVYDVGFASDLAYIVTEVLEGENLRALLRRARLDVPQAINLASQIAEALAAAHAKGIVHRDLKPENVFVLPGGRIKVLDFGLAKLIAAGDTVGASLETMSALTVAGEVVGTAAYLAPEQARGGAVDHRADIFSFGCVLYEMLAGHSPFRADTFADTLVAILREPTPSLPGDVTAVPALDRIVRRCLEKDPHARFQSASDLRFALESPTPLHHSAVPAGTDAAREPEARPRRLRLLAVSGVLLAATIAFAVLTSSGWPVDIFGRKSRQAPVGTSAQKRGPSVRQTIAVSALLASDVQTLQTRVADLFDGGGITVTRVDSTHVAVTAPETEIDSVVSGVRIVDVLRGHRLSADEKANIATKKYSSFKISVAVRQVSVRGLLQLIAASIGWSVIFDPAVHGEVTLSLTDVPWDQVVDACLRSLDLALTRNEDVWLVTTRTHVAGVAEVVDSLRVATVRSRQLGLPQLARVLEPARTDQGLVLTNPRLNAVVIVDRPDAFSDYARILEAIDGAKFDFLTSKTKSRYIGASVSLEFRNESIEDVFKRFLKNTGLNVVWEPGLTASSQRRFSGTVTDAPWDNAFDVAFQAASLRYRVDGNLLYVLPLRKAPTETAVKLQAITLRRETPAFFEPFRRYLSPQGSMTTEPQTRTLMIRDEGSRVEKLLFLIRWLDDPASLVDPASPDTPRSLVWVNRQGREEAIKAPPRTYQYPRLSPDGTRVAFAIRTENDVWIWSLSGQTLTRLTMDASFPVWTPDSRRLIFTSGRSGAANLYWQAADGTGPVERLTTSANQQIPTSISPDGTRVVFYEFDPKALSLTDLGLLVMEARESTQTLIRTPFSERNADISPDGRWIAYQSNESGTVDVYVRPFPNVSGGSWRVSTGGGTRPLWARSGSELFYLDVNNAMTTVSVQASASSFSAGKPEKLFDNQRYYVGFSGRTYDVSRDGQRFLMIKTQ